MEQALFQKIVNIYTTLSVVILNTIIILSFVNFILFILLGIKNKNISTSPMIEFDYAPYRMMKAINCPWEINEEGFRAKPFEEYMSKSDTTFRIVFLGGSLCAGYGGKDVGLPLPDLIESDLHNDGFTDIEIINLGQGGAVSRQELAILIDYGLNLNPSIIISFNGANDFLHPYPLGRDEKPNLPYMNDSLHSLWVNSRSSPHYFLSNTSVGRVINGFRKKFNNNSIEVPVDQIISSYIETIVSTKFIANSIKSSYFVFLQPIVVVEKTMSIEEKKYVDSRMNQTQIDRCELLYKKAVEELHTASEEYGFEFFDLHKTFLEHKDRIYMDRTHFFDKKGYAIMLDYLNKVK